MMINSEEFRNFLYDNGAALVGFADLSPIVNSDLNYGISIAMNIPAQVIKSISDGPNIDYYDQYLTLTSKLDEIANIGAEFLQSKGYKATAQTTNFVKESADYRTSLPHKTVATMSGIGWIGKNALLITNEFGSAVRLTSIITNAELNYGSPITESKCGSCLKCKNACPGKAISGKLWHAGVDRDEFFDYTNCRKKARQLAKENIQIEITLCGKCVEICPYTQSYVEQNCK